MKHVLLILLCLSCSTHSQVQAQQTYVSCQKDIQRQKARSEELQNIVKADQEERGNWQSLTPDQMQEVMKKDETRRKRVGEIFGEGCFSKPEDYAAAALVFQHGDTPDHFYQTFLWSKRGVDLGDHKQKRMMALGIDRYLVNIGHKQLYASQATRPGTTEASCWCLQQIEKSFPDKRRKAEADKTLSESFEWLKELNKGKKCPNTECETELSATAKGFVLGHW